MEHAGWSELSELTAGSAKAAAVEAVGDAVAADLGAEAAEVEALAADGFGAEAASAQAAAAAREAETAGTGVLAAEDFATAAEGAQTLVSAGAVDCVGRSCEAAAAAGWPAVTAQAKAGLRTLLRRALRLERTLGVLTADLRGHQDFGDRELQELVNVAREKAHAKVETYGVEQALQCTLKAMRWSARLVQSTREYCNDEVDELQQGIRMKAYTTRVQAEIELAFVRARGRR